jgi:hypothetical protein
VTSEKLDPAFRKDFAVTVCNHVFAGSSPVLLVVRDEENSWQFLCGGNLVGDACHVVGVGHLLEKDASLGSMASLSVGSYAERHAISESWSYGRLDA